MKALISLSIAVFFASALFAQQLDPGFHSAVPLRAASIVTMKKQPDGDILLGGEIAYYGNTPVGSLIRIHPDGSLDQTFSFTGYNYVSDVQLKPNGEIVVLFRKFLGFGGFVEGTVQLAILNADGSIKQKTEAVINTTGLALQEDGKILVASSSESKLIRFNEDLTLDDDFNSGLAIDGDVTAVTVSGSSIFIAGNFSTVAGVQRKSIAKLTLEGAVDVSFDPGSGTNDYIGHLTVTPEGKVITGGSFINSFNGVYRQGNVRLNANGSVDETFGTFMSNGANGEVFLIDGMMYTTAYKEIGDDYGLFALRLTENGSVDETFTPMFLEDASPFTTMILSSGDNLIINGSGPQGNVYGLIQCDDEGTIDQTFAPRIARIGKIRFGDEQNGKIIVAGDFIRIDSLNTFGVARLNSDGSVDDTFAIKERNKPVQQIQLLENETVLITTYEKFFKVDAQGDLVPEFNWTQTGDLLYQIVKFQVLPDGKIMVADPNTIARLNADGSMDETFNAGHSSSSTAFAFDMQGDSIIYGHLVPKETLAEMYAQLDRYTPTGSVDPTFDSGTGAGSNTEGNLTYIWTVKVLDNREILVGGDFEKFDGHDVPNNLVKLSPNGAVDTQFLANQGSPGSLYWLFDATVEQIGSQLYLRSEATIAVVNIDGTIEDVQYNFSITSVSDIVALPDEDEPTARKNSDAGYILALGSFSDSNNNNLSVVKIAMNGAEIHAPYEPQEPEEPNQPQQPEVTTGVNEALNGKFALEIYPTPTSRYLNIKITNNDSDFKASVFNLSGAVVAEQDFTGQSEVNTLDIGHMVPGMYVVKVISKGGKAATLKFVKGN